MYLTLYTKCFDSTPEWVCSNYIHFCLVFWKCDRLRLAFGLMKLCARYRLIWKHGNRWYFDDVKQDWSIPPPPPPPNSPYLRFHSFEPSRLSSWSIKKESTISELRPTQKSTKSPINAIYSESVRCLLICSFVLAHGPPDGPDKQVILMFHICGPRQSK